MSDVQEQEREKVSYSLLYTLLCLSLSIKRHLFLIYPQRMNESTSHDKSNMSNGGGSRILEGGVQAILEGTIMWADYVRTDLQ